MFSDLTLNILTFRSRYKWYTDWLNPTYWRRYRDPNYDRPLWNNWQPWHLDRINVKRAIRMFREGSYSFIISKCYKSNGKAFNQLLKKLLAEKTWNLY